MNHKTPTKALEIPSIISSTQDQHSTSIRPISSEDKKKRPNHTPSLALKRHSLTYSFYSDKADGKRKLSTTSNIIRYDYQAKLPPQTLHLLNSTHIPASTTEVQCTSSQSFGLLARFVPKQHQPRSRYSPNNHKEIHLPHHTMLPLCRTLYSYTQS